MTSIVLGLLCLILVIWNVVITFQIEDIKNGLDFHTACLCEVVSNMEGNVQDRFRRAEELAKTMRNERKRLG